MTHDASVVVFISELVVLLVAYQHYDSTLLTPASITILSAQFLPLILAAAGQTTVMLLTRWRDGKTLEISDSEGRFVFTDVKPGEYVLNAHPAPGGDSTEASEAAPTWFPSLVATTQRSRSPAMARPVTSSERPSL